MITYKEAINRILTTIGENPIDSEPSDNIKNPTVSIILRALQDANKRLQESGYWFNTREVTILPNFKGHLIVPHDTLNWLSYKGGTYLLRDKLACSKTGSVYFDENYKEEGKATVLVPFEDLPHSFAECVVLEAELESYLNTYGVDEHYQVLQQNMLSRLDNFTRDTVRQGKFTTKRKRAWRSINGARFR